MQLWYSFLYSTKCFLHTSPLQPLLADSVLFCGGAKKTYFLVFTFTIKILCDSPINTVQHIYLFPFIFFFIPALAHVALCRGRILGRNWDKRLKSSHLNLYHPPLSKSGLKLVWNINIVHGNLKYNSQDYAQKPQGNCTFMSSASGLFT